MQVVLPTGLFSDAGQNYNLSHIIKTREKWFRMKSWVYLLRGRDALLLVELCALFGFDVKAEAFLEGLLFQHESRAEPQIMCLA